MGAWRYGFVTAFRYLRVLAVVAVTAWWLYTAFRIVRVSAGSVEADATLKQRLESDGALVVLKQWAANRLAAQRWDGVSKERLKLPIEISDLEPIHGNDGKMRYIALHLSTGFRHRGLYIGPNEFKPSGEAWPYMNKWCDQIWYFDDVVP